MFMRHVVPQEAKDILHALDDFFGLAIAAPIGDAQGGQSEPSCGDARDGARAIVPVELRTIFHQSGRGTCFPPKEFKAAALDLVDKWSVADFAGRWRRAQARGRTLGSQPEPGSRQSARPEPLSACE